MPDFDISDLKKDISQQARDVICDVILSWARLDSLISQLALLAFGLALDGGTILLGAMDTRAKLDRLTKLYKHHGMEDAANSIRALRAWHGRYVELRNAIAHHTCAGTLVSKPNVLVFAPVKASQGRLEVMEIEVIELAQLREAAHFAADAGDKLLDVTDLLAERAAMRPVQPPLFQPPDGNST